jgi:hypothetical protein
MKSIEILFMFFTAVLAGDFKKAHGLTSKSWAEKSGPDALKKKFKDIPEGLDFEIDRIITDLPTEQVHAVVFSTEDQTGMAKVTMIREAWPGKRNAQGDWGVDPDHIEAIRFTQVKVEDTPKPEPKKEQPKTEPVNEPDTAEVPGPEPSDYAETLAKAEDMGIDIPEGTEPSLDDLKDLIFLEEEKLAKAAEAEKKPAPAPKKPAPKKPAAKKPAAKKGGAK